MKILEKIDKHLTESYQAGQNQGTVQELLNVLKGWSNDMQIMVDHKNWSGLKKLADTMQKKVLVDFKKAIEREE